MEIFLQDVKSFGKPIWSFDERGNPGFGFPQHWVTWSIEWLHREYKLVRRVGGGIDFSTTAKPHQIISYRQELHKWLEQQYGSCST